MWHAWLSSSSIPVAITGLPVLPHFLARPELLTRLEPLPVGRDIARFPVCSSPKL